MPEPVDYSSAESESQANGAHDDDSLHWAGQEPLLGRVTGELPSWEGAVVENQPEPGPAHQDQPNYAARPHSADSSAVSGTHASFTPPAEQPRPAIHQQPVAQSRSAPPQAEFHSQQALTQAPRQYQPPPRRPSRTLGLIAAALAVFVVVAGAAFFLTRDSGDDTADGQGQITASSVNDPVEAITLLLQGIGYNGVEVELRDGTLFVSGTVESRADVAAVVTASSSLADGLSINTDDLSIDPAGAAVASSAADGQTDDSSSLASNPLRVLQVSLDRAVAVAPIIFEPTITDISAWHTPTLDRVADILLANPGIAVSIVGFTDESGRAENNAAISFERASSVRTYLIDRGVSEGLLQIDPRGETEASGLRDIGYLERRVEFDVVAAGDIPAAELRQLDVGIIVPSPSNDLAFSQAMADALDLLNSERGGLNTVIAENMFDVDAATELARQQAAGGFDVVILHGAQFRAVAEALAVEYPEVIFVTGPVEDNAELPANVFAYSVAAEQGAYVLGDIAAQISDNSTIGIVGPVEASEPKRYVGGFTAGAQAQGATVLSEYIGSFNDTEAAQAVSTAQLQAGADVLTGTAQMVTGPIALAAERDIPWFANQANQTELAPNNVVASQVYHFEVALRPILAEIDAGATTGGTFPLTLGNGGMLLEFNPGYDLSLELRQRADDLLFGVTAGSISVDFGG